MNINQAKEYIKNTVSIYLKKDRFGDYKIPLERQRPVFLLGAPGIGKTAIMEQIAQELNIALVSYSMTHHTRQSAIGLPVIRHKSYEGMEYDVSEYTMSEIIATIYETMEESGIKEGILFLDEINCVSETLSPAMLLFLQYKVFGKHKVPEGWVVVTAGNPPEYNKSVREFDVVTLDRLKVINVEADYDTWRSYGIEKGIHNAIISFLDIKKEFFYHMETTIEGRSYITARGWEDLSQIISMYEEEKLKIDENLISQYLRNKNVVKEFSAYYDLYNKYKNDYRLEDILNGKADEKIISKAQNAGFDERLSLVGMLLDKVSARMRDAVETTDYFGELMKPLKAIKASGDVLAVMDVHINAQEKILFNLKKANSLSDQERKIRKRIISFLKDSKSEIISQADVVGEHKFDLIKGKFDAMVSKLKEDTNCIESNLTFLFDFVEKAFGDNNEMLILVTQLTVDKYSSRYLAMYKCPSYEEYSERLMITERKNNIKEDVEKLLQIS